MTVSTKLLESIRKIAGIQEPTIIVEAYDDDEDDDVKAAERELKKVDKKNPKAAAAGKVADKLASKVDADEDLTNVVKKDKPKAEDKPADDAPAAEKTEKAPKTGSFSSIARPMLQAGKSSADIRAALAKAGITVNHIHSRLHGLRKGLKEGFVLVHPTLASFVLAENSMMNQYQWISNNDDLSTLTPLVFENKDQAAKVIKYISEYKNQDCILTHIKFTG